MFTCNGKYGGYSTAHSHEFAFQGKSCYGVAGYSLTQPVAQPTPPPVRPNTPPPFGSKSNRLGPLSSSQHKYISDLGGDADAARWLTYQAASHLITTLLDAKRSAQQQQQTYTPPPKDDRYPLVEALMKKVPKGYYAVGDNPERVDSLTFMRVSWPNKGRFNGACKIQQVIGTGMGYKLDDYAVWWPSGQWSFYRHNSERVVLANLMHLVADYAGAAILYGTHIKQCCRCNATLTDERSRYYCIGPECETYWPWIIEEVEERKGVYR